MATKITLSTGNRYLDEDVRRLYALATQAQADIAALKAPTKATPAPTEIISPLPAIAPATTVQPVEVTGVVGVLTSYAREDHAHAGEKLIYADASVPPGNTITGNVKTAFSSSYTIPGNTLIAGQVVRIKTYGVYGLINAAIPVEVWVNIGGSQVLAFGPLSISGPFLNLGWSVDADVFVTGGGIAGTLEIQGAVELGTLTTPIVDISSNASPFMFDLTADQTITIEWQFNA